MKLKHIKIILTLVAICLTHIVNANYWTQKSDFPGTKREFPFSFSIGTKGYVGGGMDSLNNFLNDFWEYNPATDLWTQKANFAGGQIQNASGFSALNKGYVVFGLVADNSAIGYYFTNDLWEYDPVTDAWTQKSSIPTIGRQGATAFSSSNVGFAGFGMDWTNATVYNDLWKYEPMTDVWSQKANMPGAARVGAVGFTIGNNIYVGTGNSAPANYLNDFWEYDIASDTWSQKANLGIPRTQSAAFSIGNSGYLGTGQFGFAWLSDFNQYDPSTDTWTAQTFSGISRDQTAFFSIGNKGYLGLGSFFYNYYHNLNDFWEWTPSITTSVEEFTNSSLQLMMYPNPCINDLNVIIKNNQHSCYDKLVIYDMQGKIISEFDSPSSKSGQTKFNLNLSAIESGIYFISVGNIISRLVKE